MQMLKIGSKGSRVAALQNKLGIKSDGIYGPNTEKHVKRFQLTRHLDVTGMVDNDMWVLLTHLENTIPEEIDEDTDLQGQYYKTNYDQVIHRHYLPKGEYVNGPVNNEYIFLHHTAGHADPYRCIDHWGRDSRGRIATEFVLGGIDHRNNNDENDGVMVQAFPTGAQGWHLGKTGSGFMNRHSVGLEICSMGYLTHNNKTYVNSTCKEEQVQILSEPFNSYTKWHSYSDAQIKATEKWIKYIGERDQIDVRLGLKQFIQKHGPTKGFGFQLDAHLGKVKGLLTHTNVRKDKSDCYPHPDLVDMILSL